MNPDKIGIAVEDPDTNPEEEVRNGLDPITPYHFTVLDSQDGAVVVFGNGALSRLLMSEALKGYKRVVGDIRWPIE